MTEQSKVILSIIRSKIELSFTGDKAFDFQGTDISKITSGDQPSYAMVRSTGREDSVEDANPGGNDSFVSQASEEKLSASIGRVIASYFGERSLEQRLASDEDISQAEMFLPCLLQGLIGEDPVIDASKSNANIISGVVYTGKDASTIQAAPGHGELVVGSKGNVDSYSVRNDGLVFAEKMCKGFRMKPKLGQAKGKISLEQVENDFQREADFALNREAISKIHEASQYIKDMYGMEMDIEFVYNGDAKKLYIVQARAITKSDKAQATLPSALSPEVIGAKSQALEEKQSAKEVLTLHTNSAVIASAPNDVIFASNIAGALSTYINKPTDAKPLAVIVAEYAPSTSHEAGEFSKFKVPVLRVEDIEEAKKIFDDSGSKAIVIDPQRKLLVRLSEEASSNPESLIEEGLFRSIMNPYSSIMGEAEYSQEWLEEFKERHAETTKLKVTNTSLEQSIEALLNIANLEDGSASQETYKLQSAILYNMVSYAGKKSISPELLSNIYLLAEKLDEYYTQGISKANREEYLDLATKFGGLFLARPEAGKAIDSIVTELYQGNLEEDARQSLPHEQIASIGPEQNAYLKELLKLSPRFIHDEDQEDWSEFCLNLAQEAGTQNLERLSTLTANLSKQKVIDIWLNMNFVQAHKDNPNSKEALLKLSKEYADSMENIEKIMSTSSDLAAMRTNIGNFSNPDKFQQLFEDLQERLQRTLPKLKFTQDRSDLEKMILTTQMNNLVDILDLTAKSVQVSPEYTDEQKPIQVQNFKAILTEMLGCFSASSMSSISDIKHHFTQVVSTCEEQLDISAAFIMPPIGRDRSDHSYVWDNWDKYNIKTLADYHTIIHQLLIVEARSAFQANIALPESVQKLQDFKPSSSQVHMPTSEIVLEYPNIALSVNIPLRAHSAKVGAIYNSKDKSTSYELVFIGDNENLRWNKVALDLTYAAVTLGHQINNIAVSNVGATIKIQIGSTEQVDGLLEYYNKALKYTYIACDDDLNSVSNRLEIKITDVYAILDKVDQAAYKHLHTMSGPHSMYNAYFEWRKEMHEITSTPPSSYFSMEIIEALTSYNARYCYKAKHVTFEQLSQIKDVSTIQTLIGARAQCCYKKEGVAFDDLKDLDLDKITSFFPSICPY